jgi:hypothetical protein
MSNWNDLLSFARAHSGELTLSVYVAASPSDPSERQSWMVLLRQHLNTLRDQLGDAPVAEVDAFGQCVERLFEQLPAQRTMPRGQSWAFFCGAGGDQLILAIPPGVETSVHWGLGARVVPFLKVAEPEETLVVQVDRQLTRITHFIDGTFQTPIVLEAETIDEVGSFMGAAPRQGFHGGTRGRAGADEAQRARLESTDKLRHATVKKVAAMAGTTMPILLGGTPESALQLLEALPAALADRAILAPDLRMGDADHAMEAMRNAMHALRARHQQVRIAQLREAAYDTGKAALGYETAKYAAERGAIAELIFSESAWRKHPDGMEMLVRDALAEGAKVEWAEPAAERDLDGKINGVAALLRFPLVPMA